MGIWVPWSKLDSPLRLPLESLPIPLHKIELSYGDMHLGRLAIERKSPIYCGLGARDPFFIGYEDVPISA